MIDDIDYLKSNSVNDSVVIFVDSQERDYNAFPTPSEYSITFDQPFKNVYSVDILDASIPTTMYNIDIYTQDLWITTIARQKNNTTDPRTYVYKLSTSTFFSELFESPIENYMLVCSDTQVNGYDIDNVDYNNDNTDYRIAIMNTIENTNIIKKTNQSDTEYFFFEYLGKNYAISNIISNSAIINIINDKNYYLQLNNSNLYDITYFTFKYVSQSVFNSIKTDLSYWVVFSNYRIKMTIGNFQVQDFRFALNNILNDATNVYIEPVGLTDTLQGRFKYFSTDLILFNCNIRKLDGVLGFDLLPTFDSTNTNYTSMQIGSNIRVFMGNYDSLNKVYFIISPGMLNLAGYRYMILRCPEIEDHLYGSYSYMAQTPGLGMFKIAAGQNEISNLRWDYATFSKKPMHPIGKLAKLTFRFEIPSGYLYDFKGINHQFMLAIKFYSPTKTKNFKNSTLNPNYNPNLIEYMSINKNIHNKENSDNEEEEQKENNYNKYIKMLDEYDYSTSEDEDEDE
jgi:hypothetical protein